MKRLLALAALALGLTGAQPVLATTPPSFASWSAKWQAARDSDLGNVVTSCVARYGETADREIGECVVKGMRAILLRESPRWEKAVARISRGQDMPCKKAIHVYWLASRRNQKATAIYLDAHQHRDFTAVARDLKRNPYAALSSLTETTKAKANRACG